jgi:hypothetical protein
MNRIKRNTTSFALVAFGMLLGLAAPLGWRAATSNAQAQRNCREFAATGYRVCGKFLDYWQRNGGLAQQGYPISGEFAEVSDLDGKPYIVQYFERAVFELHPENRPPYDVLLSQLGTLRARDRYPQGLLWGEQAPTYEERTDPVGLIRSFYNAVNRKEYQRAYDYMQLGSTMPDYDTFAAGYADTRSVSLITGQPSTDAAAGSVYSGVPVVLTAVHTDGSLHKYWGCYVARKPNIGQGDQSPPNEWHIYSAFVREGDLNADTQMLLAQGCAEQ